VENAIENDTGENAEVNMDGDSMRIETDEGVFTTGQELPADWPSDVPAYPEAEVQFSAAMNGNTGDPGAGALFVTPDTVADVMGFYRTELEQNGWTISGNMEAAGTSFVGATKDNRVVSVAVTDVDGQTSITVGIGEQ
jgi:hypothetical protein